MKLLAVLFASALSLPAQFSLSVPVKAIAHPVATLRAAPGERSFRLTSIAILEAVNYADYETTVRGVFHGPYCEQNPLFKLPGCRINKPRFTGVKIAVAAFGVAQEVPEFFPAFRSWRGRAAYERTMLFTNVGLSIPLGIAVAGNVKTLRGN